MTGRSWNEILLDLDNPHVLQTSQWADVKTYYGWQPHYLIWQQGDDLLELRYSATGEFEDPIPRAAALVLERKALPGISVMYIPKGPIIDDRDDLILVKQVLSDLKEFASEFGVIQLKIDPDIILGWGVPEEGTGISNPGGREIKDYLLANGWRFSAEQVQFRNTVLVELAQEEEEILARMKSKTRYNIRLAGRKGIAVRQGEKSDLDTLYQMYADTSIRGGFTIRGRDYYRAVWEKFLPENVDARYDPTAQPLIAEFEKKPVAGAVVYKYGKKAWYLHGMSLPEHSEKMAPHLIQWVAISWAKKTGCKIYDMWGAPDVFDESDPMWGVYRFKSGYGGKVTRTIGAWDFPAKRFLYFLYTVFLPRVLGIMRWVGNRRIKGAAIREI